MYGKQRFFLGRSYKFWENVVTATMLVVALVVVIVVDEKSGSRKWHTAIFGTVVPFGFVVMALWRRWSVWSTWASIAICFCAHTLAIWCLFKYGFRDNPPGMLIWYPVAFFESFVLLIPVKRVDEMLTGKKEKWKLF